VLARESKIFRIHPKILLIHGILVIINDEFRKFCFTQALPDLGVSNGY
jgi:hypothetical protein